MQQWFRLAHIGSIALSTVSLLACAEDSTSSCGGDFDCKGSRVCENGQCVSPSESSAETGQGTEDENTTASGQSSDDALDEDVCLDAGGMRRDDGVCLLRCPSNPGGSIDDPNCPTGWWCHGVGYCTRYKECDFDSDCDESGFTNGGYTCFAGWCYIACDASMPCPTGSNCSSADNHCVR
jgi:hypothetical protein